MAGAAAGEQEDGRLAWIDIAKGICILLVVMMHTTTGTGEVLGGDGFLHPLVAFAKPFRMPDFFLLSGLFAGRVLGRDWRAFADRRVVHFGYFYLLWLVIHSAARYGRITDGAGPSAVLAHLALALIEPYSTLWFIYVLAVFSVVTKLLRRVPGPLLLLAAAGLKVADVHGPSLVVEEFCNLYVYFLGGALFAGRVFALAEAARRHAGAALCGLLLWAGLNGWLALAPLDRPDTPTLASIPALGLALGALGALAIVVGAALLDQAGGRIAEALRLCGQRSIVIYLAFTLPLAATREILVRTGLVTDVGLACLVIFAVAALVPLVAERLVRGTPLAALFVRPRAFHLPPAAPRAPAGQVMEAS